MKYICLILSFIVLFHNLEAYPGHYSVDRVTCPVIAAMYNHGDLVPDETGRVQVWQLKEALMDKLGTANLVAEFQAVGVAAYKREDVNETSRDRCYQVFTQCWWDQIWGKNISKTTDRWLNIFTMNGKHNVEHGFSTGTRGGAVNVPKAMCNGTFPCRKRFDIFVAPFANKQGRFYLEDFQRMMCFTKKNGDRGGEFSYATTRMLREWQMKLAVEAMLNAFGWTDEKGQLFLTLEDLEGFFMRAEYPKGWEKRQFACMFSGCPRPVMTMLKQDIPQCPDDGWWQGSECESVLEETCTPYLGYCNVGNATCVSNGKLPIPKGRCTCEEGFCVKRDKKGNQYCAPHDTFKCKYFGEDCFIV